MDRREVTPHVPVTVHTRAARIAQMLARYLGRELMTAFADEDVTEIYANPQDGLVRLDTRSRGKVETDWTIEPARVEQFLNAVSDLHGQALGGSQFQIQAELPADHFSGARLQGFLPPVSRGPTFIIRKPPHRIYPLTDYLHRGIMREEHYEALCTSVRKHENILIVGSTGSGKTTLANALLQEISTQYPSERVLILEDTVELQCRAADHLALRATDEMSLQQLVRHTMRVYPDRICVGEVRGAEALDLLDAWSTGCPGGIGTFHAKDPYGALLRLDRLCQRANVPSQAELIAEAVDLLVMIRGHHDRRKVDALVRVEGLQNDGTFRLRNI